MKPNVITQFCISVFCAFVVVYCYHLIHLEHIPAPEITEVHNHPIEIKVVPVEPEKPQIIVQPSTATVEVKPTINVPEIKIPEPKVIIFPIDKEEPTPPSPPAVKPKVSTISGAIKSLKRDGNRYLIEFSDRRYLVVDDLKGVNLPINAWVDIKVENKDGYVSLLDVKGI